METPEEYCVFVGNNIREIREYLGLSQIEVATRAGIEDSALRRIEKGRTNPTIKTLVKLGIALEVEPEYFWLGESERVLLSQYRMLADQEPKGIHWEKPKESVKK